MEVPRGGGGYQGDGSAIEAEENITRIAEDQVDDPVRMTVQRTLCPHQALHRTANPVRMTVTLCASPRAHDRTGNPFSPSGA